jgi:uncharacterized delta-60 repeat protein
MKKLNLVRTVILAASLLLQLTTLCFHSRGAAGDLDFSFDPGSGVNGTVNAVAVQPDGKVIIGGYFTTVKGHARFAIARLNADGSDDSSFNPGTVISYGVHALALQPDGKVLAGHDGGIVRLNSDGSPDSSFDSTYASTGPNGAVLSIAVQPDSKVLIGGYFNTINGTNRNRIARLNANGSLDNSFNPGTGADSVFFGPFVYSLAVQPDGKVLIGGGFTTVNGTNRNGIARLNANGSLDSAFNSSTVPYNAVRSIALPPDGKVLIGGQFSFGYGTNRSGIARLNANGSLDSSFNPGTGTTDGSVSSLALQPDGKVLIGGYFTTVNGTNRNNLARLNSDGGLDSSFNPGSGVTGDGYPYPGVNSLAMHTDGKVLVGGDFTAVNGTNRNRIARLNTDGSLDGSFDPGREIGGVDPATGIESSFSSLVVQPDGKVLVGGIFTYFNGTNQNGSLRLNANGSLDTTFVRDLTFNSASVAVYHDCGPEFDCYDVISPTAVAVQSDGKPVVAAVSSSFIYYRESGETFPGGTTYLVTRFNANGSSDTSFHFTNTASLGSANSIALQSDGKIIIGSANNLKIARLNANGSLDSSFNPGAGPNAGVTSVASQPDGKVLVGGYFTTVNGANRNGIARLNANGSLDGSFDPGTGVGGFVYSIALQPDGKALIVGDFTTVNGTNRNNIARLNANGSLDSSFNPGMGADGVVRSIALQSDGNVLIGGDFTTVNGVVRPRVARLYGDSLAPSLSIARSNAFVIVSWPVSALNFQLRETTNLSLPNAWSPVAQTAVTNGAQLSVTVPAGAGPKFFLLKSQ